MFLRPARDRARAGDNLAVVEDEDRHLVSAAQFLYLGPLLIAVAPGPGHQPIATNRLQLVFVSGGIECLARLRTRMRKGRPGLLLSARVEDHQRTISSDVEGCEDLGGGPFARAYGTVHVAVPNSRSLCAGPVERADRRSQGAAVFGPAAGGHQAAIAAARPLLPRPNPLDEALRSRCPLAEEAGVAGEDRLAPLGRRSRPPLTCQAPLEETE